MAATRYCRRILAGWLMVTWITLMPAAASDQWSDSASGLYQALKPLVGPKDAVMVTSPDQAVLVAIHADRLLVPASILKIITVSAALNRLGNDFRFKTEFYQDNQRNLIIKGYGDPLLISERMATIASTLATLLPSFDRLILDDSYFDSGLVIPGRGASEEPYDAPNGALCVNFNTVAFRRDKGRWISDEPQTPLLPAVIPKIKASGLTAGRITLAADSAEALEYTGGLFHYFFKQAGLPSNGGVARGMVRMGLDRLIWRYRSVSDLRQVAKELLEYSNNFMANQILLVLGAETFGPPANMEKGLRVLRQYCRDQLNMQRGRIVEASGISRENRISARTMMAALVQFEPHYQLLRQIRSRQYYKTGHLRGIRSRAGYIVNRQGERFRFTVLVNNPGKTTRPIMTLLDKHLW